MIPRLSPIPDTSAKSESNPESENPPEPRFFLIPGLTDFSFQKYPSNFTSLDKNTLKYSINLYPPNPPSLTVPHSARGETVADETRLAFPSDAASLSAVLRLAQRGGAAARSLILDSGAVASVLLPHVAASDRPDLQDLALRGLIHLSLEGDDARLGLVAEGAIDPVVAALVSSSSASLAATLLTSLGVVEVNKATIGAHPLAIPASPRSSATEARGSAASPPRPCTSSASSRTTGEGPPSPAPCRRSCASI